MHEGRLWRAAFAFTEQSELCAGLGTRHSTGSRAFILSRAVHTQRPSKVWAASVFSLQIFLQVRIQLLLHIRLIEIGA